MPFNKLYFGNGLVTLILKEENMATTMKQENKSIKVKQYIIDGNGRKVAAIIEMEELNRLEELLEDLSDIKSIEDRKNEPDEDYETYSTKRKSQL
jgi:hypothetical protein